MTLRRSIGATLLAAVAIGASSCGLPVNSAATPFNDSPATSACSGPLTVKIYFENGARLVPVERKGIAQHNDIAQCALQALDAGPNADEVSSGIISAFAIFPEGLGITHIASGVATVQLDPSFLSILASNLPLAYGQVVYTLTEPNTGISAVQFDYGDKSYSGVLLPSGVAARTGIVRRVDYCAIGPANTRCPPPKRPRTKTTTASG